MATVQILNHTYALPSNSHFGLGRVSGLPIASDLAKVVIPFHQGGSDDQPLQLR